MKTVAIRLEQPQRFLKFYLSSFDNLVNKDLKFVDKPYLAQIACALVLEYELWKPDYLLYPQTLVSDDTQ